jgi:hypothetical protein
MDFVACKISLGGDTANVLYRGPDRPVSWPEVRVLQFLHGEDNVFDCEFVRSEHVVTQAEKMRLLGLYGAEPVNICYPGARPMMDLDFPGDKEPLTVKRPERKLVADIGRPGPETEPEPEPPAPEPPPVAAQKAKQRLPANEV